MALKIQKIDTENFKAIEDMQDVTVFNVVELEKEKKRLEEEVVKINSEIVRIQTILDAYYASP